MVVSVESDPVARLEIAAKSSTILRLRWSPPASSNARVEFYLLSYRELESLACLTGPGSWSPLIDIDADRRELKIPDLLSYCKYEVTLSASTMAGQGRATVASATTDAAGTDNFLSFTNTSSSARKLLLFSLQFVNFLLMSSSV